MKNTLLLLSALYFAIPLFAQDFALEQLENSPRHHEWVEVEAKGGRSIHCFVAYPETSEKTLAVIVIHENRGLTDWVRSFTDQLAAEGYLAIAPDLLSGFNENISRTSDFTSSDAAREGIYQLDPDQVTTDLKTVKQYIEDVPASNGKTVVMGFCWGGSQTFRFATNSTDIDAALVFYGSAPDQMKDIKKIKAPVYGFYGENDERINAGIPATEKMMKQAGKTYEYKIYPGAGHAYMRQGDDPEGSEESQEAREASWERINQILFSI